MDKAAGITEVSSPWFGDDGVVSAVDVANGQWREITTMDKAAVRAGGLMPWSRPRKEGKDHRRGQGCRVNGVASAVDVVVVVRRWEGVAAVDKATGSRDADCLPLWMRHWDKREGRHCGQGHGYSRGVSVVDVDNRRW